jgi:hypothetical protein
MIGGNVMLQRRRNSNRAAQGTKAIRTYRAGELLSDLSESNKLKQTPG